MLQNSNNKGLL